MRARVIVGVHEDHGVAPLVEWTAKPFRKLSGGPHVPGWAIEDDDDGAREYVRYPGYGKLRPREDVVHAHPLPPGPRIGVVLEDSEHDVHGIAGVRDGPHPHVEDPRALSVVRHAHRARDERQPRLALGLRDADGEGAVNVRPLDAAAGNGGAPGYGKLRGNRGLVARSGPPHHRPEALQIVLDARVHGRVAERHAHVLDGRARLQRDGGPTSA